MAIVTSKFRVVAASSFTNRFSTDSIYLLLARPQDWDNSLSCKFSNQGSGTISDTNPPTPTDNSLNEYDVWRNSLAAVKLSSADVKVCTLRNNWQHNTKYDMYRHDISSANPTSRGEFSLSDSNMIVYVTSTGCVYKCLYNGTNGEYTTGIASTVMPTTTSATPQITADGYIWKYLFTISAADADFITADYIPVPNSQSIDNINGIDTIVVDNKGASYSSTPTITIYGDGTSATAIAITSAGVITGISVTNSGRGYTWAKVLVSGGTPTTPCSATAIIAPAGGHGSNLQQECFAHNVMIAGTISGYQAEDVPINQDFRIVSLVRNPCTFSSNTITSSGTIATANTARLLRTLTMTSTATTSPTIDDTIAAASGAQGLFVFQSSGTVNLQYIQPITADTSILSAADIARINLTTKNLYEFADGDVVTATGYSKSVSSTTTTLPEIQPFSGEMIYMDYRAPVSRSATQNEKINIVINF